MLTRGMPAEVVMTGSWAQMCHMHRLQKSHRDSLLSPNVMYWNLQCFRGRLQCRCRPLKTWFISRYCLGTAADDYMHPDHYFVVSLKSSQSNLLLCDLLVCLKTLSVVVSYLVSDAYL